MAGAGTLFLDEIGEMPSPLQVKLLRVLQERKIRRLGGSRDIPIGARIISATNRDIEKAVREGRFREDLYYRLNIVRLDIPSLRERPEDIPILAKILMERLRVRMQKPPITLTSEALEPLAAYPFPGNIRELENILERALITCDGKNIFPSDLNLDRARPRGAPRPLQSPLAIMEVERKAIIAALAKWEGNRTKTAEELGLSRRTILNKIKKYGLS